MATETVFEEAERIVNGPRQESYGPPSESLRRIAAVWSLILHRTITTREVALMMIGLKLMRETKRPGEEKCADRDSVVDICGYSRLLDLIGLVSPPVTSEVAPTQPTGTP